MNTNGKAVFGTKEWAQYTADCCKGCIHNCRYCYAKSEAIEYDKIQSSDWTKERIFWDKIQRIERKPPSRVMFPGHHDITPTNLPACAEAITRLLKAKHTLLVVSKPHADCIKTLCENFSNQRESISFRFTIGSMQNDILHYWEPYAPSLEERIQSLSIALQSGFSYVR